MRQILLALLLCMALELPTNLSKIPSIWEIFYAFIFTFPYFVCLNNV